MVKKPTDKNTKAEILRAFEELMQEKAALENQITQNRGQDTSPELLNQLEQLAKEKKQLELQLTQAQSKPVVINESSKPPTMNYPNSNMLQTIQNLTQIQLQFGSAVNQLSDQLAKEAAKLQEMRNKVATETEQLKNLYNLEVTENTLEELITQYEQNSSLFIQESRQQLETLEQEYHHKQKTWEKEKEDHKRSIKERDEEYKKTKERNQQTYQYDLQLQRELDQETYNQQQQNLYSQLAEIKKTQEKQWEEREENISDQEKEYNEAKIKVESYPQELETAIKKAKEEGKGIALHQAKIKSDLYAKELEGQKQYYQLRLQSLEQTILDQQTRINNLSQQLQSALKQVQDLAVKAIEGSSNANAYQSLKEITIEQAKTMQKSK